MNEKSRVHNSVRNASVGTVVMILNTIISFAARTVFIKTLGTEVLGINGLFTEVISMLSLVELGVGMAIIYSLYKPLSENDQKKISQLMGLYRSAYEGIALATLVIGLISAFFIDRLIKDIQYPLSYIRVVFILFVVKASCSYLFAYKTALINADQRQYVVSSVTTAIKLVVMAVQMVILIVFKNYILFLVISVIQSLATNIALSLYADRIYPFVDYREKLDADERKEILSNIKSIFVKRVSGKVTHSTDNILISTLVSTVQVGYYSNYVLIYHVVRTIKTEMTNAFAASIGNLCVTSDPGHCVKVLKRLTYLYFVLGMVMASGLLGASRPFIILWIGEQYLMSDLLVYLTVFVLFLEVCYAPLWQFLEVSGLFSQDKNIGILGSSVNLAVSLILGWKIGMPGIFIGTICTQTIQIVLKTRLIFHKKFQQNAGPFYRLWGKMIFGFSALVLVQYFLIGSMDLGDPVADFFVKGGISVCIAAAISVFLFAGSDELRYFIQFLKRKRKA